MTNGITQDKKKYLDEHPTSKFHKDKPSVKNSPARTAKPKKQNSTKLTTKKVGDRLYDYYKTYAPKGKDLEDIKAKREESQKKYDEANENHKKISVAYDKVARKLRKAEKHKSAKSGNLQSLQKLLLKLSNEFIRTRDAANDLEDTVYMYDTIISNSEKYREERRTKAAARQKSIWMTTKKQMQNLEKN